MTLEKFEKVFNDFCKKNKGQDEYIQACLAILESLEIVIDKNPEYQTHVPHRTS